jgi:polyketide-type polyunsaturated fatty acid synthase PfaA
MAEENANDRDLNYKLYTTPIAIIGMASIFPKATNLPEYWDNILKKIDCITDVPPSRWAIDDYYDPNPNAPDKTYCKRGGFIPDIDFDPVEFGLPPNILEVTDVSQLLGLVVARDAMEDAGYGEGRAFSRDNTGVILGVVGMSTKLFTPLMTRLQYPVWKKVLKSSGVSEEDAQRIVDKIKLAYVGWEENSFPGTIANVIAGRIANRLDLGGTNFVTDAACGSSLAAIKLAVGELIQGRANMMISGGVDTDNSINTYLCFSKTPAFSKSDHVRSFDAESDGMMVGEGIGMVVLKRLADAERDHDRIYAVIKGVGSSSDGRFKSIYAPSPSGQAKALRRAYQEAGYSPNTVGLIEAHGTGTMAGDPAEFQGLREVFTESNADLQSVALGSVKSQIGHTKATAGAASMIKTALALYHKVLPPTINVTKPNPKLEIETSPFYINTEARPWIRRPNGAPRRAGVSSFGFGGTNFHVALEEYQPDHKDAYRLNRTPQIVLLSAPDQAGLLKLCQETLGRLQTETGQRHFADLVNQSRSLVIPVAHARLGFVADSLKEALDLFKAAIDSLKEKAGAETWENPKGIYYQKSAQDPAGKVVALFSGQGSQYVDMGRELANNFPPIRQTYGAMDDLFVKDGRKPLSRVVFPPPAFDQAQRDRLSEDLQKTEHAQPAIGCFSVGLYKLLNEAGFKADFVAGHSFGELTALWAAGVLSDESYLALAKARGKAMAPPADPNFDAGTMVAVKGDVNKVKEDLKDFPEVTLANWNSNNQVAVAGPKPALARVQQVLTEKGYSVVPLPVSAAFHTPLVGHAQKPFAEAVNATPFEAPCIKVYSNSTGKQYASDPQVIREMLAAHILKPVLFKDEIETIYAEGGFFFIEFGPKNVLTNLVKNILADKPHLAVALNGNTKKDSDRQLREAVVQLRVAGLQLVNFDPYQPAMKVAAPKKKSSVTVTLNGGLYITEKTRSAFEKALQDGHKIHFNGSNGKETLAPSATKGTAQVSYPAMNPTPSPSADYPKPTMPPAPPAVQPNQALLDSLEKSLAEFEEHQSETLRLHEQFLQNDAEYARIFANLTQMEVGLLSNENSGQLDKVLTALESLERSMMRFHDHQSETLRVHDSYLKSQAEFSQSFARLVQQQYGIMSGEAFPSTQPVTPARPIPAPVPVPTRTVDKKPGNGTVVETPPARPTEPARVETVAPRSKVEIPVKPVEVAITTPTAPAAADISTALLEVVSEKTGYPVEMLEPSMDMEADLGIDSIKRVEILGAMQTRFPMLPKADPETLAEMRTLGQITEHLASALPQNAPAVQIARKESVNQASQASGTEKVPVAVAGSSISQDEIAAALLKVVSEKTGYPVEMLEPGMDMEADLGIDSIKRVEILGAMQSLSPALPKVEPEALSELRTLGQIIQHLEASLAQPAGATQTPEVSPVEVIPEPQTNASVNKDKGQPAPDAIGKAFLQIVSEKTGYPVEMLELSMDMEADLGIDSIKRVEILGAMQAQFPDLPKVEPEALAELRTLGQVSGHLAGGREKALPF